MNEKQKKADPAGKDEKVSEPMECWTCGLDKTGQMHSGITSNGVSTGKCKMARAPWGSQDIKCPNCNAVFGSSVHIPTKKGKCKIGTLEIISSAGF